MTESSAPERWVVTGFRESDRAAWQQLYQGYGDFYEVEMAAAKLDLVWS